MSDLRALAWSAAEEWDSAAPGRGPNEALVALIERTCRAAVETERARCEKIIRTVWYEAEGQSETEAAVEKIWNAIGKELPAA